MNKTPLKPSPAMASAVEQVYAAFRRYRVPDDSLDVCLGCCMDEKLEKEMRNLPLRQLTAKHFYEYNGSAKSTVQPTNEIKYLLPRMLDLLSQGATLHHSTELYLDRLGRCTPDAFSNNERAALDAFALVFFAEGLRVHDWQAQGPGTFMDNRASDILLMFDLGGIALDPLLDHWLQDSSPGATLHYVTASYWDFWMSGQIDNAFATDRPAYRDAMESWILSPMNRARFAERMLALNVATKGRDCAGACSCSTRVSPRTMFESVFDRIAD